MKEELKKAGLTENESKIFIALLEIGPVNAGAISRRAGLHRRVVYDSLEMLIQKGLVGYIISNNVRLYQASNPKKLLDNIKEKEQQINQVMPELLGLFSRTKEKEQTKFYKGKNGLKTVFEEQLEEKEILILGASPNAWDFLQFYFHWFDKRRVEKKVKVKAIFSKSKTKFKIPLSEVKYLPEKYSSPLAVNIYGEKVAIILWSKENPFAIVIKNKEIAEGYKSYFELMWKVAKS
jgi:sugar-specific transcriptional regulator TrmB